MIDKSAIGRVVSEAIGKVSKAVLKCWRELHLRTLMSIKLRIKTAGAVLQQIMDKLMGNLQPRRVLVYINAITVYSSSFKQHVTDLNAVFSRL